MATNLMEIIALSVSIANETGKRIRSVLKTGDLDLVNKAGEDDFDPQTAADRIAQCIIIGSLLERFPQLKIVGEEDGCDEVKDDLLVKEMNADVLKHKCPKEFSQLQLQDFVIWVDPLDGTRSFTEGRLDEVTVLIGISAHGRAIAGVIHQPFFEEEKTVGRTFWGVEGLGAFGITRLQENADRLVVVTTKNHATAEVQESVDAFSADEILKYGGCCFKVILVIEGKADVYVVAASGTKKWDTCAPEAVLRAAGGELTDACGKPIDYSGTDKKHFMNWLGVLGSRGNHAKYVARVPSGIKNSLLKQQDDHLK